MTLGFPWAADAGPPAAKANEPTAIESHKFERQFSSFYLLPFILSSCAPSRDFTRISPAYLPARFLDLMVPPFFAAAATLRAFACSRLRARNSEICEETSPADTAMMTTRPLARN